MKIELSSTKDATNITKHGISLAMAELLEWDFLLLDYQVLATEDKRENYGEVRMVGFAPMGRTVYCVVFTEPVFST